MEKIKLPRSSYEEIKKIIVAYGTLNRPAGLDDLTHSTGINKTVISANNAFLNAIGVIEGGNKKNATSVGLSLSRSLEHEMETEIESNWSSIINQNDFLTKMLQAVRIRKGMDIAQLENHIAFSSGEQKAGPVMTGARAVVDILLSSKLLAQEGDKLTAVSAIRNNIAQEESDGIKDGNQSTPEQQVNFKPIEIPANHYFQFNIQLNITANPSELDDLGTKLKKLMEELKPGA